MSKYIDRAALFNSLSGAKTVEEIFAAIQAAPAADVQEIRRGKWEQHDDEYYAGGGYWECSCCKWRISNFIFIEDARYCPHCGAAMIEEEE